MQMRCYELHLLGALAPSRRCDYRDCKRRSHLQTNTRHVDRVHRSRVLLVRTVGDLALLELEVASTFPRHQLRKHQSVPPSYVIHQPVPAPVSSPLPPQQPNKSHLLSFNRRHKQLLSTPLAFPAANSKFNKKKKAGLIHLQNSHLWRPVGDVHALEM
jgi:hypothetical protein